jgi:hypothetical protein
MVGITAMRQDVRAVPRRLSLGVIHSSAPENASRKR